LAANDDNRLADKIVATTKENIQFAQRTSLVLSDRNGGLAGLQLTN